MRTSRSAKSAVRLNCETLEDRLTPVVAYALSGSNLLAFDTVNPTSTTTTAITGITAGETLVGIDFRPQNGLLYGLGVNATANNATLYAISTRTGVAGVVGAAASTIAFQDGAGTPVDLPDPATVGYGFDFNPAVDRVRVVAGSLTFRANPNTGAAVDGDLGGAAGSVANINTDGPVNGGTTTVDAAAYTNNQPNTTITTLYTLDSVSNSLFIQNPPNAGTQVLVSTVTLGGNPLDFTAINGFDIAAGVNAPASNAPVTAGSALSVMTVGGLSRLYSINLVNGQATFIGNVGAGAAISGFAVQSDLSGFPAIGLNTAGTQLVRFNTALPGTSTSVGITGVDAGEILVGVDFRPQTGQFYGLGINATANTGTLYLLDPQTGAATAVGTTGQIAFVDGVGAPVDLPDPATVGYGFDFNPTVDRIRVVTGSGLNFRVNPNNGAPVDGNLNNTVTPPAGINTDGPINGGGSTGVTAAAYTNSFGQSLTGGVTTLYTLDAVQNRLFIQNPPNAGGQSAGLPVTLNGAPLDFSDITGFDIPAGVRVTTNNAGAVGFGYASLVVGGNTILYRIDLATGAATSIGAAPAGLSGLAMGDAPGGVISIQNATVTAAEGGSANVTFTRTGGNNGPVTITLMMTGGNAAAGTDFSSGPFIVNLPDGANSATLTLPIASDALVEGNETVVLTITSVTGALIGAQATTTLTLTDATPAPPPSIFDGAMTAGNVLVLVNAASPQVIILPPGSVAVLADLNGDGALDLAMFLPGAAVAVDGATGGLLALASDVNADGFTDLQLFNPDGSISSFTDGRTGIRFTF